MINITGCAKLGSEALGMFSAGITLKPSFVKIGQMVQHGELLSVFCFFKKEKLAKIIRNFF
jgi:hypothetical protein